MRVMSKRGGRIICDPRPKITTGWSGADGSPHKEEYFVLINPETGEINYPELVDAYGPQPTEFIISFPGELERVFNDNYVLWNKTNTKTRVCNGEVCQHILKEVVDGTTYSAGTESECICDKHELWKNEGIKGKIKPCRVNMHLHAYINEPDVTDKIQVINPMPYHFFTSSVYSADAIHQILSSLRTLVNKLFRLVLKTIKEGEKKYTLWELLPLLTIGDFYRHRQLSGKEVKQIESGDKKVSDKVVKKYPELVATPADLRRIEKASDEEKEKRLTVFRQRIRKCMNMPEVNRLQELFQRRLDKATREELESDFTKQIDLIKSANESV